MYIKNVARGFLKPSFSGQAKNCHNDLGKTNEKK